MRILKIGTVTVIAMIIVLLFIAPFPNDAQINLSNGTIRYRYFGMPTSYKSMSNLESEWLQLNQPNQWEIVATHPLKSSNNPDMMARHFIAGIVIWSKYDQELGRLFADELSDYIIKTNCQHGLPKHSIFYSGAYTDYKNRTIDKSSLLDDFKDIKDDQLKYLDRVRKMLNNLPNQSLHGSGPR